MDICSFINPVRLKRLLVDSVNQYSPSFAEFPALTVFTQFLRENNLKYSLQRINPEIAGSNRSNIICSLGPEPIGLLFVGHVDTVDLWHEGGHQAVLKGERIYGLGTADMKGGCSAMLEALAVIKESDMQLSRGVGVALVVGEEQYGDGSQLLSRDYSAPLVIIGEPTNLMPCLSHYGYLEIQFSGKGERAHAALPEIGANAIHAMLDWMLRILNECGELSYAAELAVNPREIQGGEPSFVVADSCEALVDIHLPPKISSDDIEKIIEETRKETIDSYKNIDLNYQKLFSTGGFEQNASHKVFNPLRNVFEELGRPWMPGIFRSQSDAVFFKKPDNNVVICGPGDLAVAHRRNEFVSLPDVETAARIYLSLIREVCADT
ncbi:MAG: M20/M25/M40 family metallo-hydrolase [Calditrichaeota bacterium]|nr:M20/M25/M40 family metallo-hydrolase [Calditrichota bacterium]